MGSCGRMFEPRAGGAARSRGPSRGRVCGRIHPIAGFRDPRRARARKRPQPAFGGGERDRGTRPPLFAAGRRSRPRRRPAFPNPDPLRHRAGSLRSSARPTSPRPVGFGRVGRSRGPTTGTGSPPLFRSWGGRARHLTKGEPRADRSEMRGGGGAGFAGPPRAINTKVLIELDARLRWGKPVTQVDAERRRATSATVFGGRRSSTPSGGGR